MLLIFSVLALLLGTSTNGLDRHSANRAAGAAGDVLQQDFGDLRKAFAGGHSQALWRNAGALATLQQYSMLAGQFQTTGKQLETFETGPVLLATQDPKTGQKVEVTVDNDVLQGDADNIELIVSDLQGQANPSGLRSCLALLLL